MFGLFKSKKKKETLPFEDLEGEALKPGDTVDALRYELGLSEIVDENGEFFYVSKKSGEKVSYTRMIDAATKRQKVLKK